MKAQARSEPAPRLIPDTPLPFAALRAVNADVSIDVGRLSLTPQQAWNTIAAKFTMRDGKADLRLLNARSHTGQASASLRIDSTGAGPEAKVRINAKNLLLDDVVSLLGQQGLVSGAKAKIFVSLQGHGSTLHQVAGTLNGSLRMDVGPGRLSNRVLDTATGDIAHQLLNAMAGNLQSGSHSRLECGVIRMWATDGRINSPNAMALETDNVALIAGGTIDLKDERIDLAFRTEPKKGLRLGVGQTLARLARLRGTLVEPRLGLDEAGVATSAASIGAAVATSGISLLAESLIRNLAKTQDTCRLARAATFSDLNKAEERSHKPIETIGKGIANAVEGGADRAQEGIKSGANVVTSGVKGAARGVVKGAEKAGDAIGKGLRSIFGKGQQ